MARTIQVQILGDATSLERSFRKAGDASDSFSKRMGVSMKGLAKVGAVGAAAGGVALLTKQLFASANAAKESQLAETRLTAAFDQARVKAEDRRKAQEQINRVSKRAALDDEDLSDVLAKLTRTTGSAAKGMKGMALAADIARARNISLEDAAKIVEKAHTGQLRGLKSVGVEIGKNTSTTEALERAQRKFAGSAERYGRTAAGAQDKLSVAFENLQEKVGQKVIPILQRLALKLIDLIDWSERNWPRISKAVSDAYQRIRPVIDNIVKAVQGIANVIAGVVRTIVAIKNGEWGQVWDGLKQVAVDGIVRIVDAVTALPRKILAALGRKAWAGLSAIGTAIKDAALGGLRGLGDAMVDALRSVVNRLIGLVNSAIGKFNAIPLAPDVPKIPEVGGGATTGRRGLPPGTRSSGPRDRFDTSRVLASAGGSSPTTVVLKVGERELGQVTINAQQRAGKETAASRRGPYAGQRLALG